MAKLTFEDYCDDFLGLSIGLASESELNQARAGYKAIFAKPEKKERKEVHPDAWMKLDALKEKLSRLVASQKITIERNTDKDTSKVEAFVAASESLKGRVTKAMICNLITMSSDASRDMNNQQKKG